MQQITYHVSSSKYLNLPFLSLACSPFFFTNQAMAEKPELKAMLGQGAEQMHAMMNDPDALAKMQTKMSDLMRS